jgi:hypothetical protein
MCSVERFSKDSDTFFSDADFTNYGEGSEGIMTLFFFIQRA